MVTIRPAIQQDAPSVSRLVCSLANALLVDCNSAEAKNFYEVMEPTRVAMNMLKSDRFYLVAADGSEIVGMILILKNNYVGQFFVVQRLQGRGIGSALWNAALSRALSNGSDGTFTVNSSIEAVRIYQRHGFVASGAEAIDAGFRYIPMQRSTSGAA